MLCSFSERPLTDCFGAAGAEGWILGRLGSTPISSYFDVAKKSSSAL